MEILSCQRKLATRLITYENRYNRSLETSFRRHVKLISGFTLIELLIVIAIISIATSGALLAVGDFGQSRKIQLEAQEFKNLLIYASHRAILTGQTLSVKVHQKGYDYYLWQGEHWIPIKEKIVASHTWSGATTANIQSQIIIDPQGDFTAFSFELSMQNKIQCHIRGDEKGEITII